MLFFCVFSWEKNNDLINKLDQIVKFKRLEFMLFNSEDCFQKSHLDRKMILTKMCDMFQRLAWF